MPNGSLACDGPGLGSGVAAAGLSLGLSGAAAGVLAETFSHSVRIVYIGSGVHEHMSQK